MNCSATPFPTVMRREIPELFQKELCLHAVVCIRYIGHRGTKEQIHMATEEMKSDKVVKSPVGIRDRLWVFSGAFQAMN